MARKPGIDSTFGGYDTLGRIRRLREEDERKQAQRQQEYERRLREYSQFQEEQNRGIADWIKSTSPTALEEERQKLRIAQRPQYEAQQNRNISEYIKSLSPMEMEQEEQQRRIEAKKREDAAAAVRKGANALTPELEAQYQLYNGGRQRQTEESGPNRLTPQAEFMYEYTSRRNNRDRQKDVDIAPKPPEQRLTPDVEAQRQRVARGEAPSTALTPYAQFMQDYQARREKAARETGENAESGWRDVGRTAYGMAANFESNVGQPLINLAKGVEGFGDMLYRNTGSELFKPDAPGTRLSDILTESDEFAADARKMREKVGPLGQQLIDAAGAAGNMLSSFAFYGNLANSMGSPVNATARLANMGGGKIGSALGRAGARAGIEILSNPGNFGISLGSGLSSFSDSYANGANFAQALTNGILKGMTEYYSNKLFSGTPFEDTEDKGYVTKLIERAAEDLGGSEVLQAINASTGGKVMSWIFDKTGEGMEEVVTGIMDPLIDRITYDRTKDLATVDELTEEFLGGVLLSLLMSGGEAMINGLQSEKNMTEREAKERLVRMGIDPRTAQEYAGDIAEAVTAMLKDEQIRTEDYREKSVGDPEIAARAAEGNDESLQRYAAIYNRADSARDLRRGANPAQVDQNAFLTDNEAKNFFYIWSKQGARAADAFYDQYLAPTLEQRRNAAAQDYFQRKVRDRQAAAPGEEGYFNNPPEDIAQALGVLAGELDDAQDVKEGTRQEVKPPTPPAPQRAPESTTPGNTNVRAEERAVEPTTAQEAGNTEETFWWDRETLDKYKWYQDVQDSYTNQKGRFASSVRKILEGSKLDKYDMMFMNMYPAELDYLMDREKLMDDKALKKIVDTVNQFFAENPDTEHERWDAWVAKKQAQAQRDTSAAAETLTLPTVEAQQEREAPQTLSLPPAESRTAETGERIATATEGPRNNGKLRLREESQTIGNPAENREEKLRVRGNTETGSVAEAMRRVNPEMADDYAGGGDETPLGKAVRAVNNAVKDGTISAEAGAEILGQFYSAGQDEAAKEIYLRSMLEAGTGKLRETVLKQARQIDEQRKGGLRLGGQTETAPAAEAAGAAGEEGNDLDYGGRGRLSGQRAGEQNGRLGEARRAIAQPGKAIGRRNDTKALRAEAVNAAERIPGAVEGSTITIVPDQVVSKDREMRAVAKRLEDLTGKKVYYILGNIQRKGSTSGARGAITADGIYLRCDHNDLTVTQIGAHELYHYYAKQNPGLNARLKEKIIQTFTAEEFNKVAQVYLQKLGRVNGITENMDAEAMERAIARIEEEIFADAFGNMNAFGAGADRFTETARSEVNETVGTENAAATEKKTGPPAQFGEDEDADYLAAVERGDEQAADSMVKTAAKNWGAATNENGRLIDLYHGTQRFGFTVFDNSKRQTATTGLIYTTTKREVSANYAEIENYDGVRQIGRRYVEGATKTQDIINNAKSVFGYDYTRITDEQRERLKKKTETVADKLADRIYDLYDNSFDLGQFDDEDYSFTNALSMVYDPFFIVRGRDTEGYTQEEIAQYISSELEVFEQNLEKVREVFNEHREEFKKGNPKLYELLRGFDLFAAYVELKYNYLPLISEPELLINKQNETDIEAPEYLQERMDQVHEIGSYHLYGNLGDNPLTIDAKGSNWKKIKAPEFAGDDKYHSTDWLAQEAKKRGYTSIIIQNVYDGGMMKADDYIFFNSNQLKSADPVTYDDKGNVIPLSERFDAGKQDIRWSEDEDIPQSSAEYRQQRNRVPESSAEYARMRQRELLEEKELQRLENKAKTSAEARKALAEKKRQAREQKELSKETRAEIKKLEAEIEKRRDEDSLRKIFEEQGAEALTKEVNAIKRLERQLDKLSNPQEKKKPVKKSTASIAKKQLRSTLLSEFSVPAGSKAEVGQIIDAMADKVLKDGKLTWQDQKALFDKLYNAGVMSVEADHEYQAARQLVKGGRIYVPESVKHEFGDDWNSFRMEALGQGIFLTNDSSDRGADSWNQELASEFPGLFPEDNYDQRDILERIVGAAKAGKEEQMSLEEYAATVVGQEYVSEDDLIDNMERQLDWALRNFADKAGLEIYLRDQTGVKVAEEREKAGKALDAQRAQQLARQAKERERRKKAAQEQAMKRELKDLQQRTLKQLQWLNRNRNRFASDMKAEVDKLLEDIDIYVASIPKKMTPGKAVAERWSSWKDIRDAYMDAKANDPNFLPSKELETIVARIDYKKIGDLDIGALTDLYKAAVGLRTELYNRNNVIAHELHQTFQEVYDASKEEIQGAPGGYETGAKGARDAFINDMQLTPLNRLQRMAGWNPDSKWYGMAKQLEKGERAQRRFKTEAARQLAPVLEKYKDWMKTADGQGKDGKWYEIEVPANWEYRMGDKPVFSTETVKVYMTPAQKVHMYLESKNYDNLRHMEGGRTFANKELYSKGKRAEAFAQGKTVKLLPETVKQIVSDLTEEEQALANALEKFYNEYSKKEINRVSNILYGYDKAMEGNYAPIYTNDNYTKSEPGIFDITAEGVGNLKSRVVSSNPSLNLSAFDAFEKSVDKTGRFVGMAIPIRNMNTLMNWREPGNSMKDVLDHKWGEKETKWVEELMTELQSGTRRDVGKIGELTNKALSRYISGVFGFNPSIVLKQFASYPLAGAYLGWENMPLNIIGAAKVDTDLISKYTGEYDYRQLGYATPETATLKDNPGKLQEKGPLNFLFGGGSITWMDGFTVRTLWSWAENKVSREQPDLELGDQEQIDAGQSPYYKAVAAEFEEAVSRSQPMYDIMHRSESMRNSSGIARAFTLFKTVPQQEYNMLRQAVGEAEYYKRSGADKETQTKARQKAGRAFLGVLAGNAMIGAITFLNALWKNRGKKYKDEDGNWSTENLIKELGKQFIKDSAGLSIGGSEAVDILSAILFGDKWYDIEMPGLDQTNSIITDAINAGQTITGLVRNSIDVLRSGGNWGQYMEDHSEEFLKAVDNMISTLGTYGTGLPIDNVKAYLLGGLQFISPKIKTAYEDALKKADKSGLKGLTGASLGMRVNHILQDRAKGAEDSTVEELARLYEAGYKDAIPAAQQTTISVDGEDRELNIAQQQTYKNVWSDTVSGALDELVGSRLYQAADDETRKKMIKRLYDLATDQAKSVLFDDYEESTLTKAEALLSAGMSRADYVAAVSAYNAVGGEDTSTYERGKRRRDMIGSLDYGDEVKLRLYESLTGATSRVEQFREIMDAGLSFSDVMYVFDKYSELNEREGLKAGDKAKDFALWVDTQNYTGRQKETIKDQLVYWQQMSAKTDRYDKLTETGMDATTAYNLDRAISSLEPEAGKTTVSDTQKWQAAIQTVSGEANQKKALQALMTEEQWAKFRTVSDAGISPSVYVQYKATTKDYSSERDADGKEIKGKTKKDKMMAYIDGLSLTAAQKDALYYDAGYKESTVDDAPWHKGGGKGSGSYAPVRIPTLRIPAAPKVEKPKSGLRITARPQQEAARPSGLRITARAK